MKAMQFAFGFGIAIVFPLLIHSGVAMVSPEPQWQDYQSAAPPVRDAGEDEMKAYINERAAIDSTLRSARKTFARRLFWVASPLGIGAIILGTILQVPAIGAGLVFGGIFAVIDAFGNYWQYLNETFRFVSLLLAFLILVFMGYRQFAPKE